MKGRFIVLEGVDRSGKSSQYKLLLEKLPKAAGIAFPDRTDISTGEVIDKILKKEITALPQITHMLFSVNRLEKMNWIQEKLDQGIDVICDRYYYSGIAYAMAEGLDESWCRNINIPHIEPDYIFYMSIINNDTQKNREGYGDEVFEKDDFQERVKNIFERILPISAHRIDASKSKEEIHTQIMGILNN